MVEENSGGDAVDNTQTNNDYELYSDNVAKEAAEASTESQSTEVEAEETPETETSEETKEDSSKEKVNKKPGGYKAKADYFKSQAAREAAENAALKAELAKYKNPQPKATEESGEAQSEGFDDVGKWGEHIAQKAVEQFKAQQEALAQQQKAAEAEQARIMDYTERLRPIVEQSPEVLQKIEEYEQAGYVTPHLEAAVLQSPVGEKITEHLAKYPGDMMQLAGLNEAQTYYAIGLLEAHVRSNPGQKAAVRQTSAAAPISPVKTGATTKKDISSDVPYEEWLQIRESQLKR